MAGADFQSPGDHSAPITSVGVLGLWHLGCVTAACLAEGGLEVVATDPDAAVVAGLLDDHPPVAEPGLAELLARGRHAGRLSFHGLTDHPLRHADAVWIAFDTPVDDDDHADAEWVIDEAYRALLHANQGALVIVSSQLPVGSTSRLAERLASSGRDDLEFACVPENLRLGEALSTFRSPDRFVAGVRGQQERDRLEPLLSRFSERIEWMGVESAEMTKHALNAFLATSVAFINEIASLCEAVGANASEVSRGLKSDRRIGARAYLAPGDVFAGGTLARDIDALENLGADEHLPVGLIAGVAVSNQAHRSWARRALLALLAADVKPGVADANADDDARRLLAGRRIAVWGLTYKPGTDTLRRSSALEMCGWLSEHGAFVRVHDPAVAVLPNGAGDRLELCDTPLGTAKNADALVMCTPWPEYREVDPRELAAAMRRPIVVDAGGHLRASVASVPSIRYAQVGTRP
ncbi:MAG TPA: nucleotide sugar dehydrogenase [Solirubrobacteraceae bacterium]|jgi:UDPglucose 6-dehydrogenase|nr:nucleotide sugar dehydrogenase [Solirubrobacteraceae bacterium]